jgi:hypothetical protein
MRKPGGGLASGVYGSEVPKTKTQERDPHYDRKIAGFSLLKIRSGVYFSFPGTGYMKAEFYRLFPFLGQFP